MLRILRSGDRGANEVDGRKANPGRNTPVGVAARMNLPCTWMHDDVSRQIYTDDGSHAAIIRLWVYNDEACEQMARGL